MRNWNWFLHLNEAERKKQEREDEIREQLDRPHDPAEEAERRELAACLGSRGKLTGVLVRADGKHFREMGRRGADSAAFPSPASTGAAEYLRMIRSLPELARVAWGARQRTGTGKSAQVRGNAANTRADEMRAAAKAMGWPERRADTRRLALDFNCTLRTVQRALNPKPQRRPDE